MYHGLRNNRKTITIKMKAIQRKESQSTNLNEEQKFNALIEVIENREVLLVIGRGFEVTKVA